MNRIAIIIFSLLLLVQGKSLLSAQEVPLYKNSIGGELGGIGIGGSFTYEHTLFSNRTIDVNAMAGLSVPGVFAGPVILLFPSRKVALEAGVAYAFFLKDIGVSYENEYTRNISLLFIRAGFRIYVGKQDKVFLKFGYTPFWNLHQEPYDDYGLPANNFHTWFGLGFGVRF